ncbi:unnamed protein product, partial [Prorocentrum cordatum]
GARARLGRASHGAGAAPEAALRGAAAARGRLRRRGAQLEQRPRGLDRRSREGAQWLRCAPACTVALRPRREPEVRPLRAEPVTSAGSRQEGAKLVETAKGGGMLEAKDDVEILEDFDFSGPIVIVDPSEVDQEIMGFGGAFTEVAAVIFDNLSPER